MTEHDAEGTQTRWPLIQDDPAFPATVDIVAEGEKHGGAVMIGLPYTGDPMFVFSSPDEARKLADALNVAARKAEEQQQAREEAWLLVLARTYRARFDEEQRALPGLSIGSDAEVAERLERCGLIAMRAVMHEVGEHLRLYGRITA